MILNKNIFSKLIKFQFFSENTQTTSEKLLEYGNLGLRTLVFAKKTIPRNEFLQFSEKYLKDNCDFGKMREEYMDMLAEEIENNFILMGATAIEDKLQEDVGKI